jgi:hypothetical protein
MEERNIVILTQIMKKAEAMWEDREEDSFSIKQANLGSDVWYEHWVEGRVLAWWWWK